MSILPSYSFSAVTLPEDNTISDIRKSFHRRRTSAFNFAVASSALLLTGALLPLVPYIFNKAALDLEAQTQDGYTMRLAGNVSVFPDSGGGLFATKAKKAYRLAEGKQAIKSAVAKISLREIAEDACRYNDNDLTGTLKQELNGAAFSRLDQLDKIELEIMDVTIKGVSIPKGQQAALTARCAQPT